MNPPSRAQLHYLKGLGYMGPEPLSSLEASVAIDEMKSTGDSAAAERAIAKERREAAEEERREEEEFERQNALDDLEAERELQADLAAIDAEYEGSARGGHAPSVGAGCSPVVWLVAAPFRLVGAIARAVYWVCESLVMAALWGVRGLARAGVATLRGLGFVAGRSGSAAATVGGKAAEVGRKTIIPWIGAQDWKGMARAAGRRIAGGGLAVDRRLARLAGDDRTLHLILRVAVVAGGLLAAVGLFIWLW